MPRIIVAAGSVVTLDDEVDADTITEEHIEKLCWALQTAKELEEKFLGLVTTDSPLTLYEEAVMALGGS